MSHLVLVVDDDADIRDTLCQVLEDEGYRVAAAANGQLALDYLASHPAPNLIVLDLMMPVLDGWQFMVHKGANPALAGIPVLVVTAGDTRARTSGGTLGSYQLLQKPFKLDRLLESVRALC